MFNLSTLNAENEAQNQMREQAVVGTLAKLLATEDIEVEFRHVATASFHLSSRVLTIPIYSQKFSKCVVAMNVAHEVGHALWTPKEDWNGLVKQHGQSFHSYINVTEDLRINRKIKIQYPGTSRDFYVGYVELFEGGFYGDMVDLSRRLPKMLLIDRMNLYGKVGPMIGNYAFTPEEQALIDRSAQTKTFADAMALAIDLFAYDKKLKTKQADTAPPLGCNGNAPPDDDQDEGRSEPSGEEGEEENDQSTEGSEPNGDADEDEGDESTEAGAGESETSDFDSEDGDGEEGASAQPSSGDNRSDNAPVAPNKVEDPVSETEQQFDANKNRLTDTADGDNNLEPVYLTVDKVPDIHSWMIPFNKVLTTSRDEVLNSFYMSDNLESKQEKYSINLTKFLYDFRAKHEKYISHLVTEFEMRKNAQQFARGGSAKTGTLDLNKMHQYKFSDELFKKITIMPKGKDHGMLMFIDLSGSMSRVISSVIEQACVMTAFCSRVNIPFRVFGFSTMGRQQMEKFFDHKLPIITNAPDAPVNTMSRNNNGCMVELLTHKMSKVEFNKAMFHLDSTNFAAMSNSRVLMFGGTPLNDAILSIPQLVHDMKQTTGVSKVVAMVLTDGNDSTGISWRAGTPGRRTPFVGVKSPWTKRQRMVSNLADISGNLIGSSLYTKTLLAMVNEVANVTLIGYNITTNRGAKQVLHEHTTSNNYSSALAEYTKNKFVSLKESGYKEYFIINATIFDSKDVKLEPKKIGVSTKKLASEYLKMMKSLPANRIFLTELVKVIA